MSNVVDSRVVEMKFDNKDFERNVQTSMSTLDKLKKALNLDGASKGLEMVASTAKNFDTSGMVKSISAVETRFSALQVAGVTAIANITNDIVNMGKRLAAEFTTVPLKTGFDEFELKMGSVQTIMASTGASLEEVNGYLNELNTYSDKTIYSFKDMTSNIGKFTNAGVKLKDAVAAIQGISNEAAVSGANATEASHAMYNFAQALSAGYVKLIDWKSIETANMATVEFKQQLLDTAEALGTVVKVNDQYKTTTTNMQGKVSGLFDATHNFNDALSNQWMTTEVLTQTLAKYSDETTDIGKKAFAAAQDVKTFSMMMDTLKEAAQSGWAQTWELVVGDFEQGKQLWTYFSNMFSDIIGKSADARNNYLDSALSSNWRQIGQLVNETGIKTTDFEKKVKESAEKSGVHVERLISVYGSLERAIEFSPDLQKSVLDFFKNTTDEQLKNLDLTDKEIKKFKELSVQADESGTPLNDLLTTMNKPSGRWLLMDSLKNSITGIVKILGAVKGAWDDTFPSNPKNLYDFINNIHELSKKLNVSTETVNKIRQSFRGFFAVLGIGVDALKSIERGAVRLLENFTDIDLGVLDATASFGDWLVNLRKSIKEVGILDKGIDEVVSLLSKAISKIKGFGSAFDNGLNEKKLNGFLGLFTAFWNVIKIIGSKGIKIISELGSNLLNLFANTDFFEVLNNGILSGILVYLAKFIKGLTGTVNDGTSVISNITGILDDVRESLQAYQDSIKAGTLSKIAIAVGILAASIFVLSTIDADGLTIALTAITVAFGELLGSLAIFEKINKTSKGATKAAGVMMALSVSVLLLSFAMKNLSNLSWDGIGKGLSGILGMVSILVAAAKIMDGESKAITKFSGQMILMSIAINAMMISTKILSGFSWESIGKGLTGILGIVSILVAAAKIMDSENKAITRFGSQMILLSIALIGASQVVKILGSMNSSNLLKGGTAILGLTTILVTAAKIMDSEKTKITSFGIQMILMASALAILVPIIKTLGGMQLKNIGKGLLGVGTVLGEIAIALKLMNGTASGAASLIIASVALSVLAPVLQKIGGMDITAIAKSLIVIAGAFTIIGIAGAVLSPLIPAILGLAGAFALLGIATVGIGAGITLIGVGLMSISAGLTTLSGSVAIGATAIVAGLSAIVLGFVKLIPDIAIALAEGITEFIVTLSNSGTLIAESILQMLADVVSAFDQYAPMIAESLIHLLLTAIDILATRTPEIIKAAVNLISQIFAGIFEVFKNVDATSVIKAITAIGMVAALMYALSGVTVLIPGAMAGLFGVGIVIAEMAVVLAAIGGLSKIPGAQELIASGGDFLQTIGTAIGKFVGGIVGGIASGATSSLPSIADNLSAFMSNIQPFIEGAKAIDQSSIEAIKLLADAILVLTGDALLNGLTSFITGGNALSSFADQIIPLGKAIKAYSTEVTGIDAESVTASAYAVKALAEVASILPNSGGLFGKIVGENDLGDFANQLVPFGVALRTYSLAVKGVDSDAITVSVTAAKALSDLAENLPNSGGLVSAVTGDNTLATFAMQLVPFGIAMQLYANAVSGLNVDDIHNSTDAVKAIVDIANTLPNTGGLASLFSGDNDLATFARQLIPFGKSIKEYSEEVSSGINVEAIRASSLAGKSLVDLANAIPNFGGLKNIFSGTNDMDSFSYQLSAFGIGLKQYSESVDGLKTDNIIASASAAEALVKVANSLDSTGGLKGFVFGDSDIGQFGYKLSAFGSGLKKFSDATDGLNIDNVRVASNAGALIIGLAKTVPESGGLLSGIFGGINEADFGNKLKPFGEGLKSFSDSSEGIVIENVRNAVSAGELIIGLAKTIPSSGGVLSFFTGGIDLGSFANNLTSLGNGLRSFSEAVAEVKNDKISQSITSVQRLASIAKTLDGIEIYSVSQFSEVTAIGVGLKGYAEAINNVGFDNIEGSCTAVDKLVSLVKKMTGIDSSGVSQFSKSINALSKTNFTGLKSAFSGTSDDLSATGSKMIGSLASGMQSQSAKVSNATSNMMNQMASTLNSGSSKFQTSGTKLGEAIAKGISSSTQKSTKAVKSMVVAASEAARGYYQSFHRAGGYLVTGFANGINDNQYKAKAKAQAMAKAAKTAAEKELDINSPSKEFYRIGDYAGRGFVNALGTYEKKSYKVSTSVAQAAKSGIAGSIKMLSSLISNGMDSEPTIRPVVDLSNVKAGAALASSLFNAPQSMSLTMGNVSAIRSSFDSRQNGSSNDDVVSAINGLRKDLANAGGDTYNVDGITYDDGSNIANAVRTLTSAARMERRK